MIKHFYILFIGIFLCSALFSQGDVLLELGGNNTLGAYYKANKNNPNSVYNRTPVQNKKAALSLPFVDDFSQNYIYPDYNLWEDINVYVNSSFAQNPVTYGVATFDGLDSTGTPYNFVFPTSHGAADTLTSRVIDVSTIVDSVFLSFYYQPQGNGNKPETEDSLRLEFFRLSDSSWVRMWGTPGVTNHPFKKVMVPVDTSFQNNTFQFRFINWATLSGNVDHWNLDYVYVNYSLTHADTALNDVSFITNHHNLLSEFTSMPWNHYLTDTTAMMKTTLNVRHKNNSNQSENIEYKIRVKDDNGNGLPIKNPYPFINSTYLIPPHNESFITFDISQPSHNFHFPDEVADSKVFQIQNYFRLAGTIDDHVENDTVLSYQVFHDYYSYDDGSAEVGYGLQGYAGDKLAHEFDIKKSDTLTAFQIYFSPIRDDRSGETFRLKVWSSLNPEVEVYTQSVTQFTSPIYSNTNEFLNYTLNSPLYLTAGTYYFGWEKISNNYLNVGWDVNTNNRNKVHINFSGVWQNPSAGNIVDGSLMLRPVFGDLPTVVVSTKEDQVDIEGFEVYPNPTKQSIFFKAKNTNQNSYTIDLLDVYGKVILSTTSNLSNKFDVTNVANGMYIVRFTNDDSNKSILKKIIISK